MPMMKKLIWITVVVALVACKKEDAPKGAARSGGDPAAPAAPAGGAAPAAPAEESTGPVPTCAEAIAKGIAGFGSGAEASGIKEKLQAVYTKRCTEDKWPADVLRCYAGAVGMSAMKLCRGKLPAEQGTKLQAEIMGVMAGGAGQTPPAGHGGPVPVGGPPAAPPAK